MLAKLKPILLHSLQSKKSMNGPFSTIHDLNYSNDNILDQKGLTKKGEFKEGLRIMTLDIIR